MEPSSHAILFWFVSHRHFIRALPSFLPGWQKYSSSQGTFLLSWHNRKRSTNTLRRRSFHALCSLWELKYCMPLIKCIYMGMVYNIYVCYEVHSLYLHCDVHNSSLFVLEMDPVRGISSCVLIRSILEMAQASQEGQLGLLSDRWYTGVIKTSSQTYRS